MPARLELFARIFIQSTIVVQDINEFEVVPLPHGIIIRIVRWGDLDHTGSKLHIDDDPITNNWYLAIRDEGVLDKFAVEVFVSWVVWVNSDGSITEHDLRARSGDDNLLIRTLDGVREGRNHAKHDRLFISGKMAFW